MTPSADFSADALASELSGLATESARPELIDLDTLPTDQIAALMNGLDHDVPAAVAAALPEITAAIDAIADRMRAGGRLVYVGAGTPGRLGIVDASECAPTFNTPPGLVVAITAGGDAAIRDEIDGAEDDAAAGASDLARARPDECRLRRRHLRLRANAVCGRRARIRAGRGCAHGRAGVQPGLADRPGRRPCDRDGHRSGVHRGFDSAAVRHGAEARAEHDLDDRHGAARQDLRQPHGRRAGVEREAARPRPARGGAGNRGLARARGTRRSRTPAGRRRPRS